MECKVVGSRAALEKAKFNAENYYSVIGDVSDLEATLSVLENYLPRYFNGASHIYRQMSLESSSTSRWGYKCILISCKFWAPNTIRISCLLWNFYKEGIEKCINDPNCQLPAKRTLRGHHRLEGIYRVFTRRRSFSTRKTRRRTRKSWPQRRGQFW